MVCPTKHYMQILTFRSGWRKIFCFEEVLRIYDRHYALTSIPNYMLSPFTSRKINASRYYMLLYITAWLPFSILLPKGNYLYHINVVVFM